MVRWNLKSCPKCGSDMYIEKDFDMIYKKCLMCSYQVDIAKVPVKQPVAAGHFDYEDEDYPEDDFDE